MALLCVSSRGVTRVQAQVVVEVDPFDRVPVPWIDTVWLHGVSVGPGSAGSGDGNDGDAVRRPPGRVHDVPFTIAHTDTSIDPTLMHAPFVGPLGFWLENAPQHNAPLQQQLMQRFRRADIVEWPEGPALGDAAPATSGRLRLQTWDRDTYNAVLWVCDEGSSACEANWAGSGVGSGFSGAFRNRFRGDFMPDPKCCTQSRPFAVLSDVRLSERPVSIPHVARWVLLWALGVVVALGGMALVRCGYLQLRRQRRGATTTAGATGAAAAGTAAVGATGGTPWRANLAAALYAVFGLVHAGDGDFEGDSSAAAVALLKKNEGASDADKDEPQPSSCAADGSNSSRSSRSSRSTRSSNSSVGDDADVDVDADLMLAARLTPSSRAIAISVAALDADADADSEPDTDDAAADAWDVHRRGSMAATALELGAGAGAFGGSSGSGGMESPHMPHAGLAPGSPSHGEAADVRVAFKPVSAS